MAEEKEWWINPMCFPDETAPSNSNTNVIANDTHLLSSILVATHSALENAKKVIEEFTDKAYSATPEQFYNNWKTTADSWNWLPTSVLLHKEINKPIDREYLETLKVENIGHILQNSYRYLQKTAVGLEQIVRDKDNDDPMYRNFSESGNRLRLVLTEIQNALIDHEMYNVGDEYIKMDIVPESEKSLDGNVTRQDFRDCIIFTAYVNTLEYVMDVFSYLKNELPNNM